MFEGDNRNLGDGAGGDFRGHERTLYSLDELSDNPYDNLLDMIRRAVNGGRGIVNRALYPELNVVSEADPIVFAQEERGRQNNIDMHGYIPKSKGGFWRRLFGRLKDRIYSNIYAFGRFDPEVVYTLQRNLRELKYDFREELPGLKLPTGFWELRDLYEAHRAGRLKGTLIEYMADNKTMVDFAEQRLERLERRIRQEMLQHLINSVENKLKGEKKSDEEIERGKESVIREHNTSLEEQEDLLQGEVRRIYARELIRSALVEDYLDSVIFNYHSEIMRSIQNIFLRILNRAGQSGAVTFLNEKISSLLEAYKDIIKNTISAPIKYFIDSNIIKVYENLIPNLESNSENNKGSTSGINLPQQPIKPKKGLLAKLFSSDW